METANINKVFNELKRHDLPAQPHKKLLYVLGAELAETVYHTLENPNESYEIYMTSYDARYFGRGFFETLSKIGSNFYLKCFWYNRATFDHTDEIAAYATTVFRQNGSCKDSKAIVISSSTDHHPENRALIARAYEEVDTNEIYFCTPAMSHESEENIRKEFGESLTLKIISFTQDKKLELTEHESVCCERAREGREIPSMVKNLFELTS